MTILADMMNALDVAGVKIGGLRFYWSVGAGARRAIEAELAVTETDISTRDERCELETVLGFPLINTEAYEGWELIPDEVQR